ncbi:LADA_0H16226g1_1 [Lachancea dasiensis]|uniref:Large ribosomal subunit protein bL32m n=1 Tax=Lachancea dasiensis TaxID=1072105 RepID=A0A1G4K594_9SACH|nr:LADA_0H16226g1_1 [Lachancea dasiensis]
MFSFVTSMAGKQPSAPFSFSTALTLMWPAALRPQALPRTLEQLLEKRESSSEHQSHESPAKDGIWLAVPKKKVSHQKKRQKLYGPGRKQLQMIHHLNRCPSCGHFKRANTLCMHCVGQVHHIWKAHTAKENSEPLQEQGLSDLDHRILYPGNKKTEYAKKLKDKDSYLDRRLRSLPAKDLDK